MAQKNQDWADLIHLDNNSDSRLKWGMGDKAWNELKRRNPVTLGAVWFLYWYGLLGGDFDINGWLLIE